MTRIIGARVRSLRESRDWTQGQLAYKAKTTDGQISRLENDERPGAQAVLVARLAEALGTTTDYLLGMTDDPYPPAPSDDDLEAELRAYIDTLIDWWRKVKDKDEESMHRLINLAITQAETIEAALRVAERSLQEEEERRERQIGGSK